MNNVTCLIIFIGITLECLGALINIVIVGFCSTGLTEAIGLEMCQVLSTWIRDVQTHIYTLKPSS